MARLLPAGIRRWKEGYRVFVRLHHGKGGLKSRVFPADATLAEMRAWREDERVAWRQRPLSQQSSRPTPPPKGTFADDVRVYLDAVRGMTTYANRKRDLEQWLLVFGRRKRQTITAIEIRTQIAAWGRKKAASTVNHRRKALAHLFSVLDGKHAPNPVREVPNLREPEAQPRSISYAVIDCILDAMRPSASRARLRVIAATGITPKALGRIKPEHVTGAVAYVPGRAKGKGTQGRTVPLSARGVLAFREMASADAWGPFSHQALSHAFRRACDRVCDDGALDGVRVYDLRHSFASAVYAASGDIRATQVLVGHADPRMTHRYTVSAVESRTLAALAALDELERLHRVTFRRAQGHSGHKGIRNEAVES